VAEMLELSDQEFKITVIKMVMALMNKVGGIQDQLDNVSREMENLRTKKKS
jgi:hypothetical protein